MKRREAASRLFAIALTLVWAGRPAHAGDDPLLVVVEAPPALELDAAEVRRAVANELHARTLAPIKASPDAPERALIVAVDQNRIAVSWRTSDAPPVVRAIPAPADPAARLRAIAWLAGNLARDQVSPILVENPPTAPPADLPAPTRPIEPPPVAPAPLPPSADTPPTTASTTPTVVTASARQPAQAPGWSLGGFVGPIVLVLKNYGVWPAGLPNQPFNAWQLQAVRRRADRRMIYGAVLEGIFGDEQAKPLPQVIGAHAFAGRDWRARYVSLEVTFGAGIEAARDPRATVGLSYDSPNSYSIYQLGIYGQGSLGGAVSITRAIEVVLQLGVHITMSHDENWFAASMLGVRYRLP